MHNGPWHIYDHRWFGVLDSGDKYHFVIRIVPARAYDPMGSQWDPIKNISTDSGSASRILSAVIYIPAGHYIIPIYHYGISQIREMY